MLPQLMAAVKLFGSHCQQCKTLYWICEVDICATEKWFLYYQSVDCGDYYAIKIVLIQPFPGGNIFCS